MLRPTRIAPFAVAGVVAASLSLPSLAMAADSAPPASLAMAADSAPLASPVTARTDRTDVDSTAFAGYVAPLGKKKRITGTFTVPTLNCTVGNDEGILSLIELAAGGGAQYVDGAVFSSCVGGQPTHRPVFDTTSPDGQVPIEEIVEDGDKIKVKSKFARDKITVTVTDSTQGWTVTDKFTGVNPDEGSSLEFTISVAGLPLAPLSEDSAVKGVKISGKDLKTANPTKYVMVDKAGNPVIQPSKIRKGTNFTFNYVG